MKAEVSTTVPGLNPGARFLRVRRQTEHLCDPLEIEDFVAQSMPDASPVRWHLAHTTWFFEEFLLGRKAPGYRPYHPAYRELFNSYYNAVGDRTPRAGRGLLTRPTVHEVRAYRRQVDEAVEWLLRTRPPEPGSSIAEVLELGLQHEQQHQELILTDLKHLLSQNPLRPVYREGAGSAAPSPAAEEPMRWLPFAGGLVELGHAGAGFAFDNEGPRHRVYSGEFALTDRLVNNGEYLRFMEDSGYARPELWLDEGWSEVRGQAWEAPLYWHRLDGSWHLYTLGGLRPLDPLEPVSHVSFYEADAYARWAGARLPTEAEWERAAGSVPVEGNFVESERYHPARPLADNLVAGDLAASPESGLSAPRSASSGLRQAFGDVWEWTASPYRPYPGFQAAAGALGEYNGKFMINQMVLRGGSCATPASHVRVTYRNFFHPRARWQFAGLRLAREAE